MEDIIFKRNNKNLVWGIIGLGSFPVFRDVILKESFANFLIIEIFLYLFVGFLIFKHATKPIAEVKNGVLYFYSGIGLKDPVKIALDRINSIERLSKNLIKITYDKHAALSIEAYPKVLDQIEDYFNTKKKSTFH